MTSILEIQNLITVLPEKDQALANSFIQSRNFESLKEIVDADTIVMEKKLRKLSEDDKEFFVISSRLDALSQLKMCVDEYASQFDYEENVDEDVNLFENDETEYLDHLYYMYETNW